MEFRILGPVEVWDAGHRRDLGSAKERCVLAILLWALRQPVSAESLVDRVWGERPPAKVRSSLYTYIARLRRRLAQADGSVRLTYRSGSYTLEADPESVDLYRFRRLRAQAEVTGTADDRRAALLRQADALWRAAPLGGLAGGWVERTRAALADERLGATLDRFAAELRLSRHTEILTEIKALIAEQPFVERLVADLMVALYRCGRPAEALQAFQSLRRRLTRELGTEPSPELRSLQQRILRGDARLAAPRSLRRPDRPVPPDNLPRDIPNFTGRATELSLLLDAAASTAATTAVVVTAIDGMAGIGKSTLALHAAHQMRDRFPDGRLYLRLYAHDAQREPLDPGQTLGTLLRQIGVPAAQVPRSLDERANLWRTELARRRVLIVLDDAASQEQIAPLLPGTPGCLVIVTSRGRLTGLAGVRSLSLGVLPGGAAAELFVSIAGTRPPGDREAIAQIARLCGGLPLAIELVASRLARRPTWSAADLAQRLSGAGDAAGRIHADNPEIAASFDLSYQALSGAQQVLFRRLALHPGAEFALPAAAAAAELPQPECERHLTVLLDGGLLDEPERGRFRFHELIGSYARDLALDCDPAPERAQTVGRILDCYLATADRADRIVFPHRDRVDVGLSTARPAAPDFSGSEQAREWLGTELGNLLAGARFAAEHQMPARAGLLAHVLGEYLQVQGHWEAAITAHDQAVGAWQALGDRAGQARALSDLGFMLTRTGRHGEALARERLALALFRADGDQQGEASTLDRMGLACWQSSRFAEALDHYDTALQIWSVLGHRHGEADALAHSAMCMWHTGRYDEAMRRFGQALAIYRDLGDQPGRAKTLNNVADVQQRLGRYDDALHRYQQALTIAREIRDRQGEAVIRNNMGDAYQRMGSYPDALSCYRQALAIYRDLGDRRCEADALNNIGTALRRTSDLGAALSHHQKALAAAHAMAEPYQEARSLSGTGAVWLLSGHYDQALEDYRAALELSRLIGDPYQEGLALDGIGSGLQRVGQTAEARRHWRAALLIFERLGVPDADDVRGRLAAAETETKR